MNKDLGKKFLSDLKLYSDFLGYREDLGRYETWEEACDEVFDTHEIKYADKLKELRPYLEMAKKAYKEQRFLGSQRMLQFRGNDIFKHEFRGYNCLVMYADKPEWLGNAFYLSLCGCGVGVNMMLPFAQRMPHISSRTKGTKTYTIQDSIEGWADAAHALVSSYMYDNNDVISGFEEYWGCEIKFDYSLIREKGTKVGRRFLAPGHEGLKNALDKIEEMMNKYLDNYLDNIYSHIQFSTILMYDFFMHLMNAVLSGGIRRAAASVIFSPEDTDMLTCKNGNWRAKNQQRERSNNSVGLLKAEMTKEQLQDIIKLNKEGNDVGFALLNNIFEIYNPCFEIGFTPIHFDSLMSYDFVESLKKRIMASDISVLDEEGVKTAIQCCNLCEGNGAMCKTEEDFYLMCVAESVMGTLQAGYTNFKHIRGCLKETIEISQEEALLGVSIAGLMDQPWLFETSDILKKGAAIVLDVNRQISDILGINPCARGTCIKPGGNGPVVLKSNPGATAAHSKRQFRVMQLNKETETAKFLEKEMPFLLEESVSSENHTDYVVFVPIENIGCIYKDDLKGLKHLKIIKTIMEEWVMNGKKANKCIIPTTSHNVSNTIIVDEQDYKEVIDYIYDNKDSFAAVSFISSFGDKDYNQCPNTSILTGEEILAKYGEASMFASGLVVDALHAFNNNLWEACDAVLHSDPKDEKYKKLTGDRVTVLIKKDIVRRFKQFAKNYFKSNLQEMVYCLKDVHLYHKWRTINRQFKEIDFTEILKKPHYIEIDSMGAASCSGGSCTIDRL